MNGFNQTLQSQKYSLSHLNNDEYFEIFTETLNNQTNYRMNSKFEEFLKTRACRQKKLQQQIECLVVCWGNKLLFC